MAKEHPSLLKATRGGYDDESPMGAALHSNARKVIRYLLDKGIRRDVYVSCALGEYEEVKKEIRRNSKLFANPNKQMHHLDLLDIAPTEKMGKLLIDLGYPVDIYVAAKKGLAKRVKQFLRQDSDLLNKAGNMECRHSITQFGEGTTTLQNF